MAAGTVSKLVTSFGSVWGRIRPDGETREIFFNPGALVDPSEYDQLTLGQKVEFDEEPDRANGTHALRVTTSHTLRERMAYGHISRLAASEGFGFIVEAGQVDELEFHWTAVTSGALEQLAPGQRVEFDKRVDHRDPERTRAVNIRLIDRTD